MRKNWKYLQAFSSSVSSQCDASKPANGPAVVTATASDAAETEIIDTAEHRNLAAALSDGHYVPFF